MNSIMVAWSVLAIATALIAPYAHAETMAKVVFDADFAREKSSYCLDGEILRGATAHEPRSSLKHVFDNTRLPEDPFPRGLHPPKRVAEAGDQ